MARIPGFIRPFNTHPHYANERIMSLTLRRVLATGRDGEKIYLLLMLDLSIFLFFCCHICLNYEKTLIQSHKKMYF